MKANLHNPYGYKICYTEGHSKRLVRRFKTHTYNQAKAVKISYYQYPPSRLYKPKWYIIPITIKEVKNGIWREAPF